MKIYQVVECLGEYEDYIETVIGTFSKKENAKKLKKEKEKEARGKADLFYELNGYKIEDWAELKNK